MGVKVSAVHEYTSPVNSSTSEDYAMTGTMQIDTSTIDGNVEFVHSQYSRILTQFLCPTKLLIIVKSLE